MKHMTLSLEDKFSDALEAMAEEQGLNKTSLIRQALRLYQVVHERAKKGEQLAFTKDGKTIPLLVLGMMREEKE